MLSPLSHCPPTIHNNFVLFLCHSLLLAWVGEHYEACHSFLFHCSIACSALFFLLISWCYCNFLWFNSWCTTCFLYDIPSWRTCGFWFQILEFLKRHSNLNVRHYCAGVVCWWWTLWFWNNLFQILCKFLCF
jgi:hypothetical protein